MQNYGDASERIFQGLAVGVGSFGDVWDGSAGQILTGADNISDHIRDMAKAICGQGTFAEPDSSSYLGRILDAQKYWSVTANDSLKESIGNLTDEKTGIPKDFADLGEDVLSELEKISKMEDGADSHYSKFKSNSEQLRT